MPSQIDKLEALASHLLDGFLQLRQRYALLEPMLFNQKLELEVLESKPEGSTLFDSLFFLAVFRILLNIPRIDTPERRVFTMLFHSLRILLFVTH